MPKVVVLPEGTGYWNIQRYPIGGDFHRATSDISVTVEQTFPNYHGATAKGKIVATNVPIAFNLSLAKPVEGKDSNMAITATDAAILHKAFDVACGKDQKQDFYKENADIDSHYKKLRGMSTEELKEAYKRSHRISDLRGVPRHALITDLLREKFGDRRIEKFFNVVSGMDAVPSDKNYHEARKASKDPKTWVGETARFSNLSSKAGGPGHSGMLVPLHEAGIPARKFAGGSVYVDHVAVEVPKKHEKRASKVLFGDSLKDTGTVRVIEGAVVQDWCQRVRDKLAELIDTGSISPATNEADLFRYAKQAVPGAPDDDVRCVVQEVLANWKPIFDSAAAKDAEILEEAIKRSGTGDTKRSATVECPLCHEQIPRDDLVQHKKDAHNISPRKDGISPADEGIQAAKRDAAVQLYLEKSYRGVENTLTKKERENVLRDLMSWFHLDRKEALMYYKAWRGGNKDATAKDHWYILKREEGYQLLEGAGVNGGEFAVKGPDGTDTFDTRREAEQLFEDLVEEER